MQPDNPSLTGLSQQEVEERVAQGLVNTSEHSPGKSVKEIILTNTLTYFNFIFAAITVLLCLVRSFRNLTFLPIIIGNTLIGIFQEIRAKKTLDKMSLLNAPHATVIRDGEQRRIRSEELVRDDVAVFSAGDQICADARVLCGSVSVNESLLTGEEDEIPKTAGSALLSGSFIVSGECCAVLENVGSEAYIAKLTAEAKKSARGEQSEMIRSINKIVKWMGIILIPIGALLFYLGYYVNHETFGNSIVSMVAAVIGMIPEGLYLLTTIALALGTIRLARRKVLLNDMKSIEALARVDVLCVDKTGTITEPTMQVCRILPAGQDGLPGRSPEELLARYVAASHDNNATMEALRRHCKAHGSLLPVCTPQEVVPFSSSVKYGAVPFEDGTWVLGAPEFVLGAAVSACSEAVEPLLRKGYRVLVLARQAESVTAVGLSADIRPVAFIALTNAIRKNAPETFRYFKEQGVAVKVISGDHPETVAEIARLAGIENADSYVDAATLTTEEEVTAAAAQYTVFGRVTPRQKQLLVRALKTQGHTVAMTGDGVNDILAMKDADCSIAMASGSEAVSQAAQVVLLDSDFSHMPHVVLEGRRVVNNVQRSASLFLVKNIFSLLLAIATSVMTLTYPLEPTHISLISMFTIGFPGFLLALEVNKNRIEGNFLRNVLLRALPAGLTDTIIVASLAVCGHVFQLPKSDVATAATLVMAVVGFMILHRISTPLNSYRLMVMIVNITLMAACFLFIPEFFSIVHIPASSMHLTVIYTLAAESLFRMLTFATEKLGDRIRRLREEHRTRIRTGRRRSRNP